MRKFISILFFIIFLGIIVFFLYFPDWLEDPPRNPFDYAKITEVDYTAVVVDEPDGNGKMIVTERLTFDIHAALKNNLFWELWRDLSEEYIDGVKVEYQVNSVKQILDGKQDVVYQESPRLYWEDSDFTDTYRGLGPGKWYHSEGPYNESRRQYECVFFYVDGLYREKVVFEIEYEISNAALRYKDSSELYITPYSESSIKDLESFKGQILFPNEIMPSKGNYNVRTFGTNSHDFPFKESDSINPGFHTFSFELDKSQLKFRPYNQYIEFSLISYGEDKHIFTQYASVNNYYSDDVLSELYEERARYDALPENFRITKIIVFIFFSALTFLIIKNDFKLPGKMKGKYNFYDPTIQIDYFRDIPSELDPNFAATLVFCKHKQSKDNQDGYSAVMLTLVRKGYIELERINNAGNWDATNIKIVIKYKPVSNYSSNTVCQVCGLDNSSDASYCVSCGASIPQQQPPQPAQPVCQVCGLDNSSDASYCVSCGASISQQQPPQPTEPVCLACSQKNPLGASYCVYCGTPLSKQPTLQQVTENFESLTPTEEQYFNLILRHADELEISLSSFQQKVSTDYEYTNSFVKNVKNAIIKIGVTQGYFQKAEYDQPAAQVKSRSLAMSVIGVFILTVGNIISYHTRLDFAFGAFFILGIGCIASSIYYHKHAKKYVLLTQFGEDEYVKWRGLYNFLNSETLMNERTFIELPIWEQYLIYATAFGISEKVVNALNVRCQDINMSPVLRNPYYRSVHFRSGGRSFRTATRSASFTASSGGHGGYGGGGRGGGGGGGGH